MGVHVGQPRQVRDSLTRKIEFMGPPVNLAAHITALAHGGQVLLANLSQKKKHGGNVGFLILLWYL